MKIFKLLGIAFVCFVVLIIIVAAIGSTGNKNEKETTSGLEETLEQVEVIEISASQLYQAYQDNEIAADLKYEDKVVKITGIVDSIGEELLGKAYIVLAGGEYTLFGVQCVFPRDTDRTEIATLSKGQSITVRGIVSGSIIGSVIVNDCALVK